MNSAPEGTHGTDAETQKPGLRDMGCMAISAELVLWTIAALAVGFGASELWALMIGISAGGLALWLMLGRVSGKRPTSSSEPRRGGDMFESEGSSSSSADAGD